SLPGRLPGPISGTIAMRARAHLGRLLSPRWREPVSAGAVLVGIADGALRANVVAALERADFEVGEVHDAGRLLDLARRAPPDVIVIARDLARPDSLDVVRRLSAEVATRSIPV